MSIIGIHHVQISIPRGAEDDARAFYGGILGLEEIEKPQSLRERGGFWLRSGLQQVHVGVEDGVDRAASKAHIAYEVDDLEFYRARLRNAGIKILDNAPIPGCERFEFRDPFGNRVELLALSQRSESAR